MRRRRGVAYEIDSDALYPRDPAHRWRIYARRGVELDILCATDSPGGIGEALVQLDLDERERGLRLVDRGAIGVLDAVEAYWLLMPWHRGEPVGPPTTRKENG